MACEILWDNKPSTENDTCVMTVGNKTLVSEYHHCGKPAKFIDPSNGRAYCGVHRKVADKANALWKKPLCIEIHKSETYDAARTTV